MINDDTTWAESDSFTDNIIDSLFVFGDFIYAGTSQDGKIFRSNDGKTWTEVDVSDHHYIKVMPYKELSIFEKFVANIKDQFARS